MNFIDNEHRQFFENKMEELKQYGKQDVYYKSLIYTLGICETTREHFKEIFNIKKGEININSLNTAWQTSTSAKVTRMAFSLWNTCMYDSEEDLDNGKMSSYYNPGEIFCCSYAPYFWESIKIRYPEYTKYKNEFATYNIVGRREQLNYVVEEQIENKSQSNVVGQYIRVNAEDDDAIRYNISIQKAMLDDYCKNNNIYNIIRYIDIGKSGLTKERQALQKMISDIKANKINAILVKDLARLFRNPIEAEFFLSEDYMEKINVISLDESVENLRMIKEKFSNMLEDNLNEEDDEEEFENI